MSASDQEAAAVCSECNAHWRAGVERCWLCGGSQRTEVVAAEVISEHSSAGRFSFTLTSVLGVMTLVAVALGTARAAPGLTGIILVVGLPALIVTSLKSGRRRARGQSMSWGDRVGSFLLAAATVVGIIAMLAFAAFAALFIFCLVTISGAGGFH